MAERRMFAQSVVMADTFLDLPASARCLYYTLGILADDDGFLNSPRAAMRQCGAKPSDVKLLVAQKFIIPFDSGVIAIRHWRVHNSVKKDRYKPTTCVAEFEQLETLEDGTYAELPKDESGVAVKRSHSGTRMEPERNQNGDEADEDSIQNGDGAEQEWNHDGTIPEPQVRLGKVRLGKVRVGEVSSSTPCGADDGDNDDENEPENARLTTLGGIGKGVVMLTDDQMADLLEKMGRETFDVYIGRLANFILERGATVHNHYKTLLKWYGEDSQS